MSEDVIWCATHRFVEVKDAKALVAASRMAAEQVYADNARGLKRCGWKRI